MRGEDVFAEGVATLRENSIASATTAARSLLTFALGTEDFRTYPVSAAEKTHFRALIAQHKAGCPVSKLIGARAFWDQTFYVNAHVLDPRSDSETLIEAVLHAIPEEATGQILDLGTGSGCLLETILVHRPHMLGIGVDCSPQALQVAQQNAMRLGVASRLHFVCSDWGAAFASQRRFDIIISNPPYVARKEMQILPKAVLHDPLIALDGGEDGVARYREIAPYIHSLLRPHGHVFLEIGRGQKHAVKKIFNFLLYSGSHRDLSKRERVLQFMNP
jgi:release factor glutamine methyltransferase